MLHTTNIWPVNSARQQPAVSRKYAWKLTLSETLECADVSFGQLGGTICRNLQAARRNHNDARVYRVRNQEGVLTAWGLTYEAEHCPGRRLELFTNEEYRRQGWGQKIVRMALQEHPQLAVCCHDHTSKMFFAQFTGLILVDHCDWWTVNHIDYPPHP